MVGLKRNWHINVGLDINSFCRFGGLLNGEVINRKYIQQIRKNSGLKTKYVLIRGLKMTCPWLNYAIYTIYSGYDVLYTQYIVIF